MITSISILSHATGPKSNMGQLVDEGGGLVPFSLSSPPFPTPLKVVIPLLEREERPGHVLPSPSLIVVDHLTWKTKKNGTKSKREKKKKGEGASDRVAACHTKKLASYSKLMEVFVTRKGVFIYPTQAQVASTTKAKTIQGKDPSLTVPFSYSFIKIFFSLSKADLKSFKEVVESGGPSIWAI